LARWVDRNGEKTALDRWIRIGHGPSDTVTEATAEENGITAHYTTTERERRVAFERSGTTVIVTQNRDGYGMLKVRSADETELERYYGFEMALDHAAEVLGVIPSALPVPEPAADMGM
jgi:hypothetical protein